MCVNLVKQKCMIFFKLIVIRTCEILYHNFAKFTGYKYPIELDRIEFSRFTNFDICIFLICYKFYNTQHA